DVGRFPDAALAEALDYDGDVTALVTALVQTGFLDACPTYRLLVHGWEEHADQGVKNTVKARGLGFLSPTRVRPQSRVRPTRVRPGSDPGPQGTGTGTGSSPVERSEDALSHVYQRKATDDVPDDALRTLSMAAQSVGKKKKGARTREGGCGGEDQEFAAFWCAYPRKTKKPRALQAWRATARARPP